LEREVARRDDHVGGLDLVVGKTLALLLHERPHLAEPRAELLLVVAVERGDGPVVELVQPFREPFGDPVLALGHQADDHAPSSFFSPPAPSSAFILASSSSTCVLVVSCS